MTIEELEKDMARRIAPSSYLVVPFCSVNVEVSKSYLDEVRNVFSELDDLDILKE